MRKPIEIWLKFQVIIRVKDDGVGIARENLEKLFARFGQLDSSSTRTYSGLGLGLALCRHIVELHGGFVTVQSSGTSHGTVVSVYLPVTPTTSPQTMEPPKPRPIAITKASKVVVSFVTFKNITYGRLDFAWSEAVGSGT